MPMGSKTHKDIPGIAFLVATARTHGVALATRDEGILSYAKQGFLRAVRV